MHLVGDGLFAASFDSESDGDARAGVCGVQFRCGERRQGVCPVTHTHMYVCALESRCAPYRLRVLCAMSTVCVYRRGRSSIRSEDTACIYMCARTHLERRLCVSVVAAALMSHERYGHHAAARVLDMRTIVELDARDGERGKNSAARVRYFSVTRGHTTTPSLCPCTYI